jgi:enoyl-CoA hydratase/carnithine racemase
MSELLFEQADGVLAITINRPDKKNAFTAEMYRDFAERLNRANEDRAVRAILIQGAGDSFTAGHDLSEFAAINRGEDLGEPSGLPMLRALANAKKPLVAAVHGRAVGIGLTMLLHCDLVYVAEDALLSVPFVNLALVPEAAASLLLPSRIGHVRAFELFALGQPIDGRTAQAWGIANAALSTSTPSSGRRRPGRPSPPSSRSGRRISRSSEARPTPSEPICRPCPT